MIGGDDSLDPSGLRMEHLLAGPVQNSLSVVSPVLLLHILRVGRFNCPVLILIDDDDELLRIGGECLLDGTAQKGVQSMSYLVEVD